MTDDKAHEVASPVDQQIGFLLRVLGKHRLRIAALSALAAVVGAAFSFTKPPVYRAEAIILPSDEGMSAGLLGQFIDPGMFGSSGESLEPYYRDIVLSDTILDDIIVKKWPGGRDGQERSLYQAFSLDEPTEGDAADQLRRTSSLKRHLRQDVIRLDRDGGNGVLKLAVTVPGSPTLAAALANGLLDRLEAFCGQHGRRRAAEQRLFVEERLKTVSSELEAATGKLTEFVEKNRAYLESPVLARIHADLTREVTAQTAVWVELRRQLEAARIDENKSMSIVDILDRAVPPARKAGPSRSQYGVIGAFLGFVGAFLVFCRWELRGSR